MHYLQKLVKVDFATVIGIHLSHHGFNLENDIGSTGEGRETVLQAQH